MNLGEELVQWNILDSEDHGPSTIFRAYLQLFRTYDSGTSSQKIFSKLELKAIMKYNQEHVIL